jgi:heat shock protein HtpX
MTDRASFYTLQAANRRNSVLLMIGVALLLGLLGFMIGFGLTGTLAGAGVVTAGAVGLAALLASGSYYRGDAMVLAASQAREVEPGSQPQLMNIVQEMSIAAGIPIPRVYLIQDTAPNAFATGRDPEHASIAVTTGLMSVLRREELQAVIGHELSHVRNLDIRFTLLVGVMVGGIALLADTLIRYTFWFGGGRRSRGSGRGGGGLQAVVFILAIALALVAPAVARMVQMAVSRQREYLADASAVELTRNPEGLEQALRKIASDPEVLEVANRSTQHLYVVNPIKKFEERAQGLFSTHPPIVDRINRLRALRGAPPVGAVEHGHLSSLD